MTAKTDFLPDGSSPLTRGKRRSSNADRTEAGLIPAHAGKTARAVAAGQQATAHPRSRGENSVKIWAASPRRGSSPLTRGKHGFGPFGLSVGRLIPAHAGKTV